MYDRTTVQGATFNMRGQLYRGRANATALSSCPVVSALGSESDDPGSSPGRGKVLCPWDVRENKMRASLLALAKSIYYQLFEKRIEKLTSLLHLRNPCGRFTRLNSCLLELTTRKLRSFGLKILKIVRFRNIEQHI